jgi:hypothetical protein
LSPRLNASKNRAFAASIAALTCALSAFELPAAAPVVALDDEPAAAAAATRTSHLSLVPITPPSHPTLPDPPDPLCIDGFPGMRIQWHNRLMPAGPGPHQPSLTRQAFTRELRPGKPVKAVTPKPRSGEGGPASPT